MLISSSIPNLLNGVSQQPPSVRSRSQAELQENALSSPARGLEKRPPTRHVAAIPFSHNGTTFVHTIKYSTDELYILMMNSGGIRIYDKNGVAKTVTGNPGGLPTYFGGITNYAEDIAAVTASDTTILVNKRRIAQMSSSRSPTRSKEGLVYIKQGDFNLTYTLVLKYDSTTTSVSFATPDGSTASQGAQANSTYIMTQLVNQLTANTALAPAGFSFVNLGSTLHIYRSSGDFSVSVEDSRGGQYIIAAKDSIRRFLDLPNQAPNGFIIKVNGNAEDNRDEYYVKYTATDGSTSSGVWVETVAPNSLLNFDTSTMPHRIVKKTDGTFEFSAVPWDAKNAGDDDSIPVPSFIDGTINDVFFYRNRMGFLSGENVVFSESGSFFNFFPTTAVQLLDSDPIDVAVSNVRPSILRHAVPFNESLLLFSNLTQFVLTSEQLLTPASVSIEVATNFEADLNAKPAPAGRYVYFATKLGSWAGMREYYVDAANEIKDAADVTGHVPNYIKGGVTRIAASSNEDMLVCMTDADPKALYVYKWYWKGTEKVVSSWSRWVFKGNVRGVEFNGSEIYILLEYTTGGLYLEKIVLSADDAANELTYTEGYVGGGALLLDRRVRLTIASLPYSDPDVVFVNKTGKVIPSSALSSTISADGFAYGGIPYTFKYEFSQQFVMQNEVAITDGWLTIKEFRVSYANSAYFQVAVDLTGRGTSIVEFTGNILGSLNATIGDANLEAGIFRVPVNTKSQYARVTLQSSSHLPCKFQSAEWVGNFVLKSNRV